MSTPATPLPEATPPAKVALPRWRRIASPVLLGVIVLGIAAYTVLNTPERRTRRLLRTLEAAVLAYRVDHQALPRTMPLRLFTEDYATASKIKALNATTLDSGSARRAGLTTPVAYIAALPEDPFQKILIGLPMAAIVDGDRMLLFSAGPDSIYDTPQSVKLAGDEAAILAGLLPWSYDPTNGIVSPGDIHRLVARPVR